MALPRNGMMRLFVVVVVAVVVLIQASLLDGDVNRVNNDRFLDVGGVEKSLRRMPSFEGLMALDLPSK